MAACVCKTYDILKCMFKATIAIYFALGAYRRFRLVCMTMTISISFFGACMKLRSEVELIINYLYSFACWPPAGSMTIQRIVIGRTIALLGCVYIYIYAYMCMHVCMWIP